MQHVTLNKTVRSSVPGTGFWEQYKTDTKSSVFQPNILILIHYYCYRYACSKSGHIFEVDLKKVAIHHVRRLLPLTKSHNRDKHRGNTVTVPNTFEFYGKIIENN